jgi:YrbI family 3-deoxy-D-manno-octulosonate 8-phosphate phosphatase
MSQIAALEQEASSPFRSARDEVPVLKSLPALTTIHTIVFDFDGVFTDNKVWVDQNGKESVRCDRGDGLAFDLVRAFQCRGRLAAEFFILSKEANPVVMSRAKKLKLDCRHNIGNKLDFMVAHFTARFPDNANPFAGLVYLGNDLNDLPLIRRAGYSVVPNDAHPLVKKYASLILHQNGGDGFVRAFIEELLEIGKLSIEELCDFVSLDLQSEIAGRSNK